MKKDLTPILVNTFHHEQFRDKAALLAQKKRQGLKISLAFPTLNEQATIAKEIFILRTELMERTPLLDEIAIIDSGSTDRTRELAAANGAKVFVSRDILASHGWYRGKGENLWKSLFVLAGDIIVWIDADISNISPKFVYGLVGPLLENPQIGYVKAFYERPIRTEEGGLAPSGGGRVTEILVRPLLSLFYPALAHLIQPLSGEYAGRRSLLERLPFSVGYGVELGHLIDIYHGFGAEAIAQVNVESRIHRNQSVHDLGRMSFGILTTFFRRLERYGEASLLKEMGKTHLALSAADTGHRVSGVEVPAVERPPMTEIEEYRKKFGVTQV